MKDGAQKDSQNLRGHIRKEWIYVEHSKGSEDKAKAGLTWQEIFHSGYVEQREIIKKITMVNKTLIWGTKQESNKEAKEQS